MRTSNSNRMSPEEYRTAWHALSREERRFVRAVAELGETAGSAAGNALVASYAAQRLRVLRLGTQALVTLTWVGYLVTAFTLLRETPTVVLSVLAVACAVAQAAWFLRAEDRLQRAITANARA